MRDIKKIEIKTIKKYRTRKERLEEEKKRKLMDNSPLLLIIYIVGMIGIVWALSELINVFEGADIMIMGVASVETALLWYLYFYRQRGFVIASVILISAASVIIMPQIYSMSKYIWYIEARLASITDFIGMEVAIAILMLLIYLIFALEFVLRNHSIMFLMGIAILLAVPSSGHEVGFVPLIMIIIFETGFFVLNMTDKRKLKYTLIMPKRARAGMLSTLITIGILVCAFVPAVMIEQLNQESMFRSVYHADGFIQDIIAKFTGGALGDVSGGKINRGNLYQSGQTMLEVKSDFIPDDRIYLHDFRGSDYYDSEWESAFHVINYQYDTYSMTVYQEPFINKLAADCYKNMQQFEKDSSSYDSASQYYNYMALTTFTSDPISEMYFMLSKDTVVNKESYYVLGLDYGPPISGNEGEEFLINPSASEISIKHVSQYYDSLYIPYYSSKSKGRIWEGHDIKRDVGYKNEVLNWYDISMLNRWDEHKFYESFTDAYISKIQEEYTRYPNDVLSRLEEYCRATPLTDLSEITTYILVTLQNKAKYTTTPGSVPYNKDTIDYFLFENGQGYCVHFASTAALMYRMYGIPARYVSGYVLEPQLFEPSDTETGVYNAEVSDYYAHAWVEIFLKDYGWVPVEVTPTDTGRMITQYPGYTSSTMYQIMHEHGWSFRDDNSNDVVGNGGGGGTSIGKAVGGAFIAVPILAVLILAAYIIVRKLYIKSKLVNMDCRRLFHMIMKGIHFAKLLKTMNGSEKDFTEKLSEHITSLSKEELDRMIEAVQAENYANEPVTEEERGHVEYCLRKLYPELYSMISLPKKPLFLLVSPVPLKSVNNESEESG